jgi:hypothetical protein
MIAILLVDELPPPNPFIWVPKGSGDPIIFNSKGVSYFGSEGREFVWKNNPFDVPPRINVQGIF